MFKILEKNNHLAVHAHCSTRKTAEEWIAINAVEYCAKGYFMNKTLTPESFCIAENK